MGEIKELAGEKIFDSAQNVCIVKKKHQRVFVPNNTALNSSGLKFCLRIIFKESMQIKQFCPYKLIIY